MELSNAMRGQVLVEALPYIQKYSDKIVVINHGEIVEQGSHDELIQNKEFLNLKGLIYFTDGYGVFPSQKPSYDTAFVFLENDLEQPEIPAWAIKLVLSAEEIRKEEEDGYCGSSKDDITGLSRPGGLHSISERL